MTLSDKQADSLYVLAGHVFKSLRSILHSVGRDDAIQSAILFCIKNAAKWDPDKSSFNTYFSMVCRHSMIRANRSERRALDKLSGPTLSYAHEDSESGRETAERYLSCVDDNVADTRDEYDRILKVIPGLSAHQQKTIGEFMGPDGLSALARKNRCSPQAITKSRRQAFKNVREALSHKKSSNPN